MKPPSNPPIQIQPYIKQHKLISKPQLFQLLNIEIVIFQLVPNKIRKYKIIEDFFSLGQGKTRRRRRWEENKQKMRRARVDISVR